MYQSGELIVYGGHGVCRVEQVAPAKEAGGKPYYTLKPLYGTETIYIPVDTHVFMRSIITRQEAEELVRQIPFIQEDICSSRKPAELKNHYEECLQTHDCHDLVQLMKGVYVKNRRAEDGGRRPGQVDMRYGKRAEELLYGELAAALNIPKEKVEQYIVTRAEESLANNSLGGEN